jgi:hypothetical protein
LNVSTSAHFARRDGARGVVMNTTAVSGFPTRSRVT